MTQATQIIPQKIALFIRDDEIFVNSRIVAESFKKAHGHVLRDIDGLIEQGVSGFGETPFYEPQNGQTYRSFDMDRDAFSILSMGFTGARAMKWKLDYVRAFNAMEAELKARTPAPAPMVDLSNPTTLRTMLLGYTERVIELEAKVSVQSEALAVAKPKTDFYDDFADAEGLVILTDIGRVLGVGPVNLLRLLVEKGVLFRTSKGAPLRARAEYMRRGWFVTKTKLIDDVARIQTFATPRGIQGVAEMLDRPVDLFGQRSTCSLQLTKH